MLWIDPAASVLLQKPARQKIFCKVTQYGEFIDGRCLQKSNPKHSSTENCGTVFLSSILETSNAVSKAERPLSIFLLTAEYQTMAYAHPGHAVVAGSIAGVVIGIFH
jgi:hypothetical protein